MFEIRSHLSTRILTAIIAVVIVLTTLILSVVILYIRALLNSEQISEGTALANALSQGAELGVLAEEPSFLRPTFAAIMAEPHIVFAAAYDARGNVILEEMRSPLDSALPLEMARTIPSIEEAPVPERIATKAEPHGIDLFTAPVRLRAEPLSETIMEELGEELPQGHRTIGLVRIGLSRSHIRATILNTSLFVLASAGIVLGISIVLAIYLAGRITRPIRALEEGTRRIARGQLDVELPTTARDEVGALAHSFNAMVRNLRQTTVSRDYMDGLVRSINDILVVTDGKGQITRVNEKAAELLGFAQDELIGRSFEGLFERKVLQFKGLIWNVLEERGSIVDREALVVRKDGGHFYASLSGSILSGFPGEIEEAVFTIRDITERKESEDRVLQEKLFSEALINSLPGIFTLADEEEHTLRWNRNLEEVTGYSGKEIERMKAIDFFAEQEREEVRKTFQEVVRTGSGSIEATVVTKDGRRIPHLISGVCIRLGEKVYVIGTGIDIAGRKDAERQLKEKMHQIQKFNELMIGREKRIIDMKEEVNALLADLKRPPRYGV